MCIDLKYLYDADKNHHVMLSMVDAGTGFHMGALVKNREARTVVKKFLTTWIAHYGVPELVIADQGGEFEGEFEAMMEEHNIDSRLSGAHAAWQNGIVERHGAILGETWNKVVYEHGFKGRQQAKTALAIVLQAKNATMTRNGFTPEQAVFGRALRWTENQNRDDGDDSLAALGSSGEAWLSSQIRTSAKMALVGRDASDKLRRAAIRRAPAIKHDILPGTVV